MFKVKNPRSVAHRLRQAFASSKLAENKYQKLKDIWRVKEQIDCIVCARRTDDEPTLIEEIKEIGTPFPTITRIEEVVGVCLENRHRPIIFPNFKPTPEELLILEKWGETSNVEFHYTENKLTARPKHGSGT